MIIMRLNPNIRIIDGERDDNAKEFIALGALVAHIL